MNVFQIECEWDIGQEYLLFSTRDKAEQWILENSVLDEMAQEEGMKIRAYIESLEDEGYLQVRKMEVL